MINIKAIFIKQLTSMIKAPALIAQGVIFLLIALAFTFLVGADDPHDCEYCIPAYVCTPCELEAAEGFQLPVPSGVVLFTVVFIGLALMGSVAALVHEDKTTTNLRFMAMADVRPHQYLIGTLTSVILVVAIMLVFYALAGGYLGRDMIWFMIVGISGGIVSTILGVVIALSKAPILASPISIILGLGPTLSSLNPTLANALRFTFIQQVHIAMADLSADLTPNLLIIAANGGVVLLAFILMHRTNRFKI